jgi:hypothetical protein
MVLHDEDGRYALILMRSFLADDAKFAEYEARILELEKEVKRLRGIVLNMKYLLNESH